MRSYEPNPKKVDELELVCEFPRCSRTFYTTNPKAVYCCDSHRAKHFRKVNEERLKHERNWNNGFKHNDDALGKLFQMDEKLVSKRELNLVDFDFDVMPPPQQTQDGRLCYVYYEYGLVKDLSETGKYEIVKMKKKK